MKSWSENDIKKLGLKTVSTTSGSGLIPKSEPKGLVHIKNTLSANGIEFIPEHKFHDQRRFRFDVAIITEGLKIGIEYEGLSFNNPDGKSGHTTIGGFISNCQKYNLAAINGWIVLRYTANNYRDFYNDLQSLLCLKK